MPKRSRSASFASIPSSADSSTSNGTAPSTSAKQAHISLSPSNTPSSIIECHLPPHSNTIPFATYTAYEEHYAKDHVNRCLECGRNFPTPRYLELHIAENHDVLRELKEEKGEKTYGCFVDGCDKMCSKPQRRRLHLIDKHGFPKNYDFFVINDGLDRRSSLLRPPPRPRMESQMSLHEGGQAGKSETLNPVAGSSSGVAQNVDQKPKQSDQGDIGMQEESPAVSQAESVMVDFDQLASSMSALRFVPSSIRFGRGRGRGGLARR